MGNTSFFANPTDEGAAPQVDPAESSTDETRQTSFYAGGIPEGIGAGSWLALLIKAVERAEDAADRAEAAAERAEQAEAATTQLFIDFVTKLYMGEYTSPPQDGYFGAPLITGVLYYDSTDAEVYVWTGEAWQIFASQIGPIGKTGPAGLPGI